MSFEVAAKTLRSDHGHRHFFVELWHISALNSTKSLQSSVLRNARILSVFGRCQLLAGDIFVTATSQHALGVGHPAGGGGGRHRHRYRTR